MHDPKKGTAVIVVEGPHKGTEGVVESVAREYDRETNTTGKRVRIRISDPSGEDERIIKTRLIYVREA